MVSPSVTLFLSQVSGLRSQDSGLGTDVAVGAVNVVGAVGLRTQVSGLRSQDSGLRTQVSGFEIFFSSEIFSVLKYFQSCGHNHFSTI